MQTYGILILISSTLSPTRGCNQNRSGTQINQQSPTYQTQCIFSSSQLRKGLISHPCASRAVWASPQLPMGLGLAWHIWLKLRVIQQRLCFQGDRGNLTGPLGQDTTLLLRKFPLKKLSWNPINQLEGRCGQPSSGLINNRTCPVLEGVSLFSELRGYDKPSPQEEMGHPHHYLLPRSLKPQWVQQVCSPRQRPQHPRGHLLHPLHCKPQVPQPSPESKGMMGACLEGIQHRNGCQELWF